MNPFFPKRLPYTVPALVIGALSFVILIATVIWTAVQYGSLPDTIATHYDAFGRPDGYGAKSTLLGLLALDVGIWVMCMVLAHYPRTWNIPVMPKSDRQMVRLAYATRFVLYLFMVYMTVIMGFVILSAQYPSVMGIWFLVTVLVAPVPILIGYLIYAFRFA